jgi:hypothetical protein
MNYLSGCGGVKNKSRNVREVKKRMCDEEEEGRGRDA